MEGDRGTDVRDRIVYCWPTVLRQKKKRKESKTGHCNNIMINFCQIDGRCVFFSPDLFCDVFVNLL